MKKGFTLIELIVVVAIISLVSSIALTSLDIARNKARDATLVASVNQMRTTLEQEYITNKSYDQLLGNPNWRSTVSECDGGFTGTYAENAIAICKKIISDSKLVSGFGGSLWIGPGRSGSTNRYSIMVYLPGQAKYHCVGFDEEKSTSEDGSAPIYWTSPGCWYNY